MGDFDPTTLVAIVGIAATLASGIVGPFILEHMRRESTRREHLLRLRTDVYADLLRVTALVSDNAVDWSVTPHADLEETDPAELDAIMARVRVVGSSAVYDLVDKFTKRTLEFYRRLDYSRHQQFGETLANMTGVDAPQREQDALQARTAVGQTADELRSLYRQLLKAVRSEVAL